MQTKAVALDDRTSDASTIARGAAAGCGSQFVRFASYSAYIHRIDEGDAKRIIEKRGTELAIAAILEARVRKSKPIAPPSAVKQKPKGTSI
jgi:uncharacterized membrane protein